MQDKRTHRASIHLKFQSIDTIWMDMVHMHAYPNGKIIKKSKPNYLKSKIRAHSENRGFMGGGL
jgi:hypothetical protein